MTRHQKLSRNSRKGQRIIKKLTSWRSAATVVSAAAASFGLAGHPSQAGAATTYDWDPGSPQVPGAGSFNSGNWDTTATNKVWTINSTGTNDVVWANTSTAAGAGNNAIFGGTQNGTASVNIDSYVNVGNLTFNTAGYTINANSGFFLDGQGGTNVTTITTNANATVNSIYDDLANNSTGGFGSLLQTGAGTLTFGNASLQYWGGAMTINGSGTSGGVTLTGSNNNPQFHYSNAGINNGIGNLTLNGGTLDIQGNTPVFGTLSNTSTTGGLFTSTTETGSNFTTITFRTSTTAAAFNGTIAGNLNLVFEGLTNTQTLQAANTFGGSLNVYGGTVSLASLGTALNASSINVEGGWLTLDNTLSDATNRVSSSAPLSLTAGTINLIGNASSLVSQQSFGTATLGGGYNLINLTPGGTTGAASITFANVNTIYTNHAGLSFNGGASLGLNAANSVTNSANIILTQINGSAASNSVSNGILPSNWLVLNGSTNTVDFATLAADGQNVTAYTGYTVTNGAAANFGNAPSTANVLVSGTNALAISQNVTINSLNLGSGYTKTALTGAHTMTLGAGGLIINSAANFAPSFSVLTAGTSTNPAELNIWFNSAQGTGLWTTQLTDNTSGGSVTLVKGGPGQMDIYQPNHFTYTGGTIINQGTILLNDTRQSSISTSSDVPGQITINNGGTLNYNAAYDSAGTNANSWVINDGGTVSIGGSEYSAGITFNNNGGQQAGNITIGNGGTKSIFLQGSITSHNNSLTSVPTIIGGGTNPDLDMGGTTRTFNVEGSAPDGLSTSVNFVDGSILKTGPGGWLVNFQNNGTNSSLTGLEVQQGPVITTNNFNNLFGPSTAITLDNTGSLWMAVTSGTAGTLAFNGGTLANAAINTSNGRGAVITAGQNIIVGQNAGGGATTNGGSVLLYDPLEATYGESISLTGNISGSNTLNVTGSPYIQPAGYSLSLTGTNSTFTGTYNETQNAGLVSKNVNDSGSSLGSTNSGAVTVALTGAALTIDDSGLVGSTNGVSNQLLNYGANISVTSAAAPFATNTLTVQSNVSGTATANTIGLNNLTLVGNPTLTINNANAYKVQFSGTVSGGGTLAGTAPVTVTGTVAPGDQPAILNVTGANFAFSGGTNAAYAPEIVRTIAGGWQGSSTTNAGVSYDQINVSGASALAINSATLDVRMSGISSLAAGDEFFLVNETGAPGTFGQIEMTENSTQYLVSATAPNDVTFTDPTNSSITYELTYTGNITTGALTGGNDIVLDVTSVPEPTSLSLIGLGAAGLLLRRRRRTSKKA